MGNLLDIVKRVTLHPIELIRREKSEKSEKTPHSPAVSSHNSHNSQSHHARTCVGWNTFMQQRSPEAQHILGLIQQAYPEGVPAQVPIGLCLLCGWRYPAVLGEFKGGGAGLLCVACYLAEQKPEVDRSVCAICDQPINGRHYRTDPGGPVVCSACWQKYSGVNR